MKPILVIDNYDSYTYNLVQLLRENTKAEIVVWRNDQFKLEDVEAFDQIILSPGPGIPSEAGLMPELVKTYAESKSILGICLGHQCIAEVFGAKLLNLSEVFHGRAITTNILDADNPLFVGLANQVETGRYHSWTVEREGLPDCIKITAEDDEGIIMALKHESHRVYGCLLYTSDAADE